MYRLFSGIVFCTVFTVLVGCSGFDSTDIIMHPDSTAAGATFDVALVDVFTYMDSTSKVSGKIERDSLHLAIGLPASWSVLGAQYVVMSDLTKAQKVAWLNDELGPQELAVLLQKYQATAAAMSADASLPAMLGSAEFTAHNQSGEGELPVTGSKIGQWKGFKSSANIVLQKGAATDTAIVLDSLLSMMSESGAAIDTSMFAMARLLGYTIPDTVGMCVVPVAIFLKVQAAAKTGNDTLYYYTKTGKVKLAATTSAASLVPDMDTGDMVFKPIQVVSSMAVKNSHRSLAAAGCSIVADRASGTVRINLGNVQTASTFIDIYSLRGNLVKRLTPASSSPMIVWNGTDERGNRAGAGSYLVRIAQSGGNVTKTVQLMR